MSDVLSVRARRLLDRHACFQRSVGEISQHRVRYFTEVIDPDCASVFRRTSGLRLTATRMETRGERHSARRLKEVTTVHESVTSCQFRVGSRSPDHGSRHRVQLPVSSCQFPVRSRIPQPGPRIPTQSSVQFPVPSFFNWKLETGDWKLLYWPIRRLCSRRLQILLYLRHDF